SSPSRRISADSGGECESIDVEGHGPGSRRGPSMSESTATSAAAGGTLSETEARSLRALYPVMERVRPRLDAAIDVVAAQIPTFAVLLRGMDESTRRTHTGAARELERAATLE